MNQPKAAPEQEKINGIEWGHDPWDGKSASAQDEIREAFEIFAKENNGSSRRLVGTDQYMVENVQAGWTGFKGGAQWQATRQAAQTYPIRCPDGVVYWSAGTTVYPKDHAYTKATARLRELEERMVAPSDLHATILALPLPEFDHNDRDGCVDVAYSYDCMENFRKQCAELVANAAPVRDMVQVAKKDGNDYCRILSILGMEEDGDPVAEVQRLFDLANASVQTAVAVPRNYLAFMEVVICEHFSGKEYKDLAARCVQGGEYGAQVLRIAVIYDAMIDAAIAATKGADKS